MFQFLRSQAKVFYWVIAATFILFLFLGGMTSGRGCSPDGSRQFDAGVAGTVNGDKISRQAYQMAVSQQTAQMRQQAPNRDLNSNQYAQAEQSAWDGLVQAMIFQQAIEEMKIEVSDEEILSVFENNPPPELLAQYRDAEGNVDINRYYADLQNPEVDWSAQEAYLRQVLPWQKLTETISAGAIVTDEEIREEYVRQTGRAAAEYMGVVFADLAEDFEPTEEEITAWYNGHPDDYQAPAKAQVKAVRFAKLPSDADKQEIRNFILEIREEIVSGQTEFATAAIEYSDDTSSSARGGDLGIFDRNRMVAPFTEAAFALPVGEVSQPVETKFGFHLIEVLKQSVDKDTGEVYEVEARHILLKVTPGPDTLDLLQESAEAFRARVNESNFALTAEAEAMDLVSPPAFIEGRDIPGIALSVRGSNWTFNSAAGDVSPVFENRDNFYIVLNEGITPAGLAPLEEVRGQVTLALRKEKQIAAARALLGPAVGEVQMGRTLAEVAAANGLAHAVTDTFTVNGNVPEIGYGTVFNLDVISGTVGELIPEIETNRGLYAAIPLWIQEFDTEDFATRSGGIRAALLGRAQNTILQEWYDDRLARAEIKDQRFVAP